MQRATHSDSNSGTEMKTEDSSSNIPLELREDFDHRNYRPLEVDVSVIMHDIQAHLLKVNCYSVICTLCFFYRHFKSKISSRINS